LKPLVIVNLIFSTCNSTGFFIILSHKVCVCHIAKKILVGIPESSENKNYHSIFAMCIFEIMDAKVDFSYLEEMAEGKADFIKQVLTIFMDNTPKGLKDLEKLIKEKASFEKIQKQAHFLKSSFGIVKVEGMQECLQQMESLAREGKDRQQIEQLIKEAAAQFSKAEKIIKEKMGAS